MGYLRINSIIVIIQININDMVKSELQVYARIKPPSGSKQVQYSIDKSKHRLEMEVNRNKIMSFYKDNYDFNFTRIFDKNVNQQEIFKEVALPVIRNCLDGYNGTIFAYGQTGSGKTFTMSGGDQWKERGIMPRVLTSIFEEVQARSNEWQHKIMISFMEIYNENAYDLFQDKHLQTSFDKWNKITFYEDDYGQIQMKNLSIHEITEEEKGIDLLMKGNHIKKVSSTSLNQSSSRSHCVFTINILGRNLNDDITFVSKLHLVDLAGSQRLSKSQVEGSVLNEAKSINLSLSYLEQVIVALNDKQKKNRIHIPYRNSLMTTILKDSLGGNCKTAMIATISIQYDNIDETISTLRFSQRVGKLQNQIIKNSKQNFQTKYKNLQKQNQQLRRALKEQQKFISNYKQSNKSVLLKSKEQNIMSQLSMSQQKQKQNKPSSLDLDTIHNKVELYLNDKIKSLQIKNVKEANVCFSTMKELYQYRTKEYITELTFISEKLHKYDELLSKKKTISLRQFSDC